MNILLLSIDMSVSFAMIVKLTPKSYSMTIAQITKQQNNPLTKPILVLTISILISSFAVVIIRFTLASGLPPLVIMAGRLVIASLFLTPFIWANYKHEIKTLDKPYHICISCRDCISLTLYSIDLFSRAYKHYA